METIVVAGEPTYRVEIGPIVFCVTVTGAQVGPVLFQLPHRIVQPFNVAPWAGEASSRALDPMLRVLRGDFFCMPFGENKAPYQEERYRPHGETANQTWSFGSFEATEAQAALELALETEVRPGRVGKTIGARAGECVVYQTIRISEMEGPMCYGHHAMLRFPQGEGSGLVSVSPFVRGQVLPKTFEHPDEGGYQSLCPGATFDSLMAVESLDGSRADLSRYPARKGFEDLVMVCADPQSHLAWSAVVFPDEGYVWFGLKDRRTLPSTVLWHSNGGRHYAPWNGRHTAVLGIEEVCAYFHLGPAPSVAPNPVSDAGVPTFREFRPDETIEIRYAMGVHPVEPDTGRVVGIDLVERGANLRFENGSETVAPLDAEFLRLG